MFCLNDTLRYHLCPSFTDMCKGINTLTGEVKEKMCANIRNDNVLLGFINDDGNVVVHKGSCPITMRLKRRLMIKI